MSPTAGLTAGALHETPSWPAGPAHCLSGSPCSLESVGMSRTVLVESVLGERRPHFRIVNMTCGGWSTFGPSGAPVHSTGDWRVGLATLSFLRSILVPMCPGDCCILATRMLASIMLGDGSGTRGGSVIGSSSPLLPCRSPETLQIWARETHQTVDRGGPLDCRSGGPHETVGRRGLPH